MFYTIILTDTQAIYAFPTLTAATERYHSELAYAMNQNFNCTALVIDKQGAVYRSEMYTAEVAQE